jgi:hypothetical protein
MTDMTRYLSSAAFKAQYSARTGFDLDDPDRRVPVRGHDLAFTLTTQLPGSRGKAEQLLKDRRRSDKKDRARALTWLAPLGGLIGWPERSQAHDHHPPLSIMLETKTDLVKTTWINDLLAFLGQIDVSHPLFGISLGGALLMTQTIAILQRRALMNSVASQIETQQPDFFPETLPSDTSPTIVSQPTFVWKSDSATRQGQIREENQDAVLELRFADGSVVLIVCDGAGGLEGGRDASQTAIAAIGTDLQRCWDETGNLSPEDLTRAIAAAREEVEGRQLPGVTTALVVLLQGDRMSYATLGDGAVAVVWPDGMVGQVQVPHHTAGMPSNIINAYIGQGCVVPPRIGTLQLELGAIVMVMSDGASDLFPFEDFALNHDRYPSLLGLADTLLMTLEEARDPDSGGYLHSDNLTLTLARLEAGGGDDQAR